MIISVVGIDAAFAHMGLARAFLSDSAIRVEELKLINTEGNAGKTVRKNSDDLRRAQELREGMVSFCTLKQWTKVAFVEIPHGSQSARGAWSLGIAVGVLASCPVPIIQVSALEVKLASVGKKTASKSEMIEWARHHHPKAGWRLHKNKLTADNEHLADAIAAIYAGLKTDQWRQLMSMMQPTTIERKRIL